MVWNCVSESTDRPSRDIPPVLSLAGLIMSGLVVILFLADLVAGFPFQRVSIAADIGFVIAGAILAYLSWSIGPRRKA